MPPTPFCASSAGLPRGDGAAPRLAAWVRFAPRAAAGWLAALSLVSAAHVPAALLAQAPMPPPAPVRVAPVAHEEVAAKQRFLGTVLPKRRSVVGSAVDGRVDTFEAREGEWVVARAPLVQLRTATIELEIKVAEATLELRARELEEFENGTRAEVLAQLQAKMLAAKAANEYARARFMRTQALRGEVRGAAISQEELDRALSEEQRTAQELLAAQAAVDEAQAGPRAEQIMQARARKLQAQEEVRRLEDIKSKYSIRAPFDGYLVARMTEVGAWVRQGEPVLEVIEVDPVEVEIQVPERHITRVRAEMAADVFVPALAGEPRAGRVLRVVPQADLRSRAFPVKIHLDNAANSDGDRLLKAGMLAEAELEIGEQARVLLVPKDAVVLKEGQSPRVFIAETDPKSQKATAKAVAVTLGSAYGDRFEVRGDLRPGDLVVTRGNESLMPGQPLIIQNR